MTLVKVINFRLILSAKFWILSTVGSKEYGADYSYNNKADAEFLKNLGRHSFDSPNYKKNDSNTK